MMAYFLHHSLYSADDYTRGYMNSKAMVSFDGNVFWPPPTKFRSTCPVDVTYFPFDDQTCIMKLGSWTYDGFQVHYTSSSILISFSLPHEFVITVLTNESRILKEGFQSPSGSIIPGNFS